jgi:DcuC family C4-dicarboxylate transporter
MISWRYPLALAVLGGAVSLAARKVEVRLILLGAGLLLAGAAGAPLLILDSFARGMVAAMVAPICAAMGFAAVLAATGCDQHLSHLLLVPVRRVRWLALPGGILAAYLVNLAVPSQTSTAAALGPVLLPLLIAAGLRAEIAGAALVLGASFGGDLLNPGAQDIQAVAGLTGLPAAAISARVAPASLAGAAAAALAFSLLNRGRPADRAGTLPQPAAGLRVNPLKAVVPLLPVLLLLLSHAGFPPLLWLRRPPAGSEWAPLQGALPVVRAMLIGTAAAALLSWREIQAAARRPFDGMGAAYGSIISLTICAQCFGAGITAIGLGEALLGAIGRSAPLAYLLAAGFPWGLAVLSGSGSGPILAFAQAFLGQPDRLQDPPALAALACLAGAFGRTMSPVAAVVIYTAGLAQVPPLALVRRLLPALLVGAAVAFLLVLA